MPETREFIFEWGSQGENEGEFDGWCPTWDRNLDPMTAGFSVAHDVLEHRPDYVSPAADHEAMAMGAAVYVRALGGWWSNFREARGQNPAEVIGSEYESIWHCAVDNGLPEPEPVEIDCEMAEDMLHDIAHFGWLALESELHRAEDEDEDELRDYCRRITGWLRVGYVDAARTYNGVSCYEMAEVFREIQEAIDDMKGGEVGQLLRIRIEFPEGMAPVVTLTKGHYDIYNHFAPGEYSEDEE